MNIETLINTFLKGFSVDFNKSEGTQEHGYRFNIKSALRYDCLWRKSPPELHLYYTTHPTIERIDPEYSPQKMAGIFENLHKSINEFVERKNIELVKLSEDLPEIFKTFNIIVATTQFHVLGKSKRIDSKNGEEFETIGGSLPVQPTVFPRDL